MFLLLKPTLWPSWAFMGIAWLIGHLPWKAQQAGGRLFFGRLLYFVAPRRRNICFNEFYNLLP